MEKIIIVLLIAISSISAYEIDVVNCRSALHNDPPPSDKMLDKAYNDMWHNPDDFVCAYSPCDFHHKDGWFAIKKDRTMLFQWSKPQEETMTIYYDRKKDELIMHSFNTYGIRSIRAFSMNIYNMLIDDILLAGVQQCSTIREVNHYK